MRGSLVSGGKCKSKRGGDAALKFPHQLAVMTWINIVL